MIPDDERRLLERIRHEPAAFGELFDANYSGIFAYVFRRIGEFDVAKDIAADTFLKAWQNIGRFRWRGTPLSAWLFRIATNEINLYFRNARYESTAMARLAADPAWAARGTPAMDADRDRLTKELARHHEFLMLRRELRGLSASYQDVIALRYFEGKRVKEIAEILELKEGTVKSLLSRGIDRLRERCAALDKRREPLTPEREHR